MKSDKYYQMLANADIHKVVPAVATVLSNLDKIEPQAKAAAIAAAFLMLCQEQKIDPRDALRMTRRMIDKAGDYGVTEFEAARMYLEQEEIGI